MGSRRFTAKISLGAVAPTLAESHLGSFYKKLGRRHHPDPIYGMNMECCDIGSVPRYPISFIFSSPVIGIGRIKVYMESKINTGYQPPTCNFQSPFFARACFVELRVPSLRCGRRPPPATRTNDAHRWELYLHESPRAPDGGKSIEKPVSCVCAGEDINAVLKSQS